MKAMLKLMPVLKVNIKCGRIFIFITLILFTLNIQGAQAFNSNPVVDTTLQEAIKVQLDSRALQTLHFPNSVKRFYTQLGFEPAWVKARPNPGQTWEAMLMLDCVLQFGLSHDDYHPKDLLYDHLHTILEKPALVTNAGKAQYDILLTDALLAFINHLHYGKLNPEFTSHKIDEDKQASFNAETTLINAMHQKDFMKTILEVQPKSKMYTELQYQMHLLEGVYQGDCYDIPEATVRKIAINMERIRWTAIESGNYLQLNIPSFSIKLFTDDTTYEYKVLVGKPASPTPAFNSSISYFTTATELKIPQRKLLPNTNDNASEAKQQYAIQPNVKNPMGLIYFWFANKYGLSLEGRPEKALFKQKIRALTNGTVKVENGEQLAQLLLKQDAAGNKIKDLHKAIRALQAQNFILTTPVPLKITYITCEVKDGVLVNYNDIYKKDAQLERALYNVKMNVVMK